MMQQEFNFLVTEEYVGKRLDMFLVEVLKEHDLDVSRTRIKGLLSNGCVRASHKKKLLTSDIVRENQNYTLRLPQAEASHMEAEEIPLDIYFEDEHLLVINKPAGMVVHPAPGNPSGTLVNALLHYCGDSLKGISGAKQPGIVHRLDKWTAGLMLAAKTEEAHKALSAMLAAHNIKRTYWALCWGTPQPPEGTINKPIGRSFHNRQRMAIHSKGKPAVTHYKVLKTGKLMSLVECELETGRTHQIRLHMASLGHGVVNDPFYGRGPKKGNELVQSTDWLAKEQHLLVSKSLKLIHPITKNELSLELKPSETLAVLGLLVE